MTTTPTDILPVLFRELPAATSALNAHRYAWTVTASQEIASQGVCPAVTTRGVRARPVMGWLPVGRRRVKRRLRLNIDPFRVCSHGPAGQSKSFRIVPLTRCPVRHCGAKSHGHEGQAPEEVGALLKSDCGMIPSLRCCGWAADRWDKENSILEISIHPPGEVTYISNARTASDSELSFESWESVGEVALSGLDGGINGTSHIKVCYQETTMAHSLQEGNLLWTVRN